MEKKGTARQQLTLASITLILNFFSTCLQLPCCCCCERGMGTVVYGGFGILRSKVYRVADLKFVATSLWNDDEDHAKQLTWHPRSKFLVQPIMWSGKWQFAAGFFILLPAPNVTFYRNVGHRARVGWILFEFCAYSEFACKRSYRQHDDLFRRIEWTDESTALRPFLT